ncbi:hypothetical protein ABEB36_005853 [Hypothenemus hampei]|uniref:Uncharacterized protein n=1 Tax=Hypothenemus hampei TaxID=57062 RepID=A0ABD1EZM4_HYPHA
MAMTKRMDVSGKIICQGKVKGLKNLKQSFNGSPNFKGGSPTRLSPVKVSSVGSITSSPTSEISSSRSSPGLVAGYYASCKFSEPPSASALPLPPVHWMITHQSVMLPFQAIDMRPCSVEQDFTHQLKLLLKVQA